MGTRLLLSAVLLAGCAEETGDSILSPGNESGQDEDPSLLVAMDGSLYAVWYSNRNGMDDKELFLVRSTDGGRTFTDPPIQVTRSDDYSFYPSLAQSADGRFHLAWWRVVPLPGGGTINRILYKSSLNGIDWDLNEETVIADGPGDWLPSLVYDGNGDRLLVYFASPVRDPQPLNRIYVAIHDGSGWGAPQRLTGANADDSHNTFPQAAQRADGRFVLTWTRYDASSPNDVLHVIQEPTTDTLRAVSDDGIAWTDVTVASGAGIDVFPSLIPDASRSSFAVLWITAAGETVERREDGTLVDRPEIGGYSAKVVPAETPGTYWGAWVEGEAGRQKIHHRFFAR